MKRKQGLSDRLIRVAIRDVAGGVILGAQIKCLLDGDEGPVATTSSGLTTLQIDSVTAVVTISVVFGEQSYGPVTLAQECDYYSFIVASITDVRGESVPRARKTPVALVIKGGGVKGLAFAGAVQVLEEYGYQFNTYVGSSAGAISAVLLASGYNGQQLETELQKQDFSAFLDPGPSALKYLKLVVRGWMHSGDPLVKWINELVAHRIPAKAGVPEIPLREFGTLGKRAIVYAAGRDGGAVTFDSGGTHLDVPAARAARFSGSIPGFFKAEKLNGGQYLYDGGSLHNFPVDIFLKSHPGAEFIGLFLSDQAARSVPSFWMKFGLLRVLSDVVSTQLKQSEAELLERFAKQIIIIDASPINTTEFRLAADKKNFLVQEGRAAALKFLAQYRPEDHVPAAELIRAVSKAEGARQKILHAPRSRQSVIVNVVIFAAAVAAVVFAAMYIIRWYEQATREQVNAAVAIVREQEKSSSGAAYKAGARVIEQHLARTGTKGGRGVSGDQWAQGGKGGQGGKVKSPAQLVANPGLARLRRAIFQSMIGLDGDINVLRGALDVLVRQRPNDVQSYQDAAIMDFRGIMLLRRNWLKDEALPVLDRAAAEMPIYVQQEPSADVVLPSEFNILVGVPARETFKSREAIQEEIELLDERLLGPATGG